MGDIETHSEEREDSSPPMGGKTGLLIQMGWGQVGFVFLALCTLIATPIVWVYRGYTDLAEKQISTIEDRVARVEATILRILTEAPKPDGNQPKLDSKRRGISSEPKPALKAGQAPTVKKFSGEGLQADNIYGNVSVYKQPKEKRRVKNKQKRPREEQIKAVQKIVRELYQKSHNREMCFPDIYGSNILGHYLPSLEFDTGWVITELHKSGFLVITDPSGCWRYTEDTAKESAKRKKEIHEEANRSRKRIEEARRRAHKDVDNHWNTGKNGAKKND